MAYKRLFIWVEGPKDVRFFNATIKPLFERKYNVTLIRHYSQLKKAEVSKFLKSIKAMKDDYIFTSDINDTPCVTAKKQQIQKLYTNVERSKIAVVVREIEGWYLAGLDDSKSKKIGVRPFRTTDTITKEQFNSLIPKKFDSHGIDFMSEILKCFSIRIAKQKNKSFNYFIQKYLSL